MLFPQSPQASTPNQASDEEQRKAERLAKLEAWKQRQALERERKDREAAAAGPRALLDEIDRKASVIPINGSPRSPVPALPMSHIGKFDPKAIAKKVTGHSTGTTTLGEDIPVPVTVKTSSTLNSATAKPEANASKAVVPSSPSRKRLLTSPL